MFSISASKTTAKLGFEAVEMPNFDGSLATAFERVAATFPSRIAIGSDMWEPTYRELNDAANRLAHQLIACGVGSGDRVVILMMHDGPMVAAVLGILKAGSIVVAFDPSDPLARLKMLMEDAEPSVIVTDMANQKLAAALAHRGCSCLNFESASAMGPVQNPSIEIPPQQTAFLTYTSGTTGSPKGVMQSHRQLRRAAAAHTEAMQYTENDRIPLFATVSTGQGSVGLWWILLNGAMLCPFSLKTRGIAGLPEWIIFRRLTAYVSSASIFRTLVKTIDERLIFTTVRAVRLASEAVTADDFEAFRRHFPRTSIFVHTLSSSETSNIAWSRWTHDDNITEGTLPVGHFSRDVEVSLLGDDGQPVVRGEVGEIVVKSRYLANGYWRDPELTAARFSADLDGMGTRLVRTGDRGRINDKGLLEFCGRKDDRIKIRGNRIELRDIERALEGLPGIDRVAVVAIRRDNHEPVLVAFVVKQGNAPLTAARLRHAIRAKLPRHMMPSRIMFLNSLPYNKGNKIDREALQQCFHSVSSKRKGEQPQTETEMLLADIWAEALDVPDISRDDDFFNLGGDSLSGAVVTAQIHALLGVDLTLEEIADHPTVSALATVIEDCRRLGTASLRPIVPVPRGPSMPASFFQEQLWNYYRESPASLTLTRVYRVIGPLDIAILKECLSYLVDRHEILRTTFGLVDGHPAQIIHPSAPLDFSFVDLIDADDPEAQADSILRKEDAQQINLERLPILRHVLMRVAHENYLLARIFSRITSDGPASHILNTELALLYEARLHGIEPPLPRESSLQYADYAAWQHQVMRPNGSYFNEVMAWWKSVISTATPASRLPFRRLLSRAGLDPSEGVLPWKLNAGVVKRLDQVACRVDATHFTVRLAAFVALIADITGNSSIVVNTIFVSRNHVDARSIVGPFANTTPLLFSFDATKTFLEWLEIVRDRVFETRKHSELSYEQIKQQLRMDGIEPPDGAIIFAMSSDHSDQRFGDLAMSNEVRSIGKMQFGCQFYVEAQKPENCRVYFDAGVYDRNGMRVMVNRYLRLLEAAADEPELPIGKLLAMTGANPARWICRNYAERIYESSPLLKLFWRRVRNLIS
jgi:amino acid adenylation domain-containing protein